jgi:hypothetical protein
MIENMAKAMQKKWGIKPYNMPDKIPLLFLSFTAMQQDFSCCSILFIV